MRVTDSNTSFLSCLRPLKNGNSVSSKMSPKLSLAVTRVKKGKAVLLSFGCFLLLQFRLSFIPAVLVSGLFVLFCGLVCVFPRITPRHLPVGSHKYALACGASLSFAVWVNALLSLYLHYGRSVPLLIGGLVSIPFACLSLKFTSFVYLWLYRFILVVCCQGRENADVRYSAHRLLLPLAGASFALFFLPGQLSLVRTVYTLIGIVPLYLTLAWLTRLAPEGLSVLYRASKRQKCAAAITTACVFLAELPIFLKYVLHEIPERFPLPDTVASLLASSFIPPVCVALVVPSLFFLYPLFLTLIKQFSQIVKESCLLRPLVSYIPVFVIMSLLGTMLFVCFQQSPMFYESCLNADGSKSVGMDLLYSSDSPLLLKHNAFIGFFDHENDVRQPLLGGFAAPLMGLFSWPAIFSSQPASLRAALIQLPQVALMLFGLSLLARCLHPSRMVQIGFLVLASATYTTLLNSVMIEQYIFASFWCVLSVVLLVKQPSKALLPMTAAASSLVTSSAFVPFLCVRYKSVGIKSCIQCLRWGLLMVGLLLFLRFDIIVTATQGLVDLSNFTGAHVPINERWIQFTSFVSAMFMEPSAGPVGTTTITWQLARHDTISYVGLGLFALALFSAWVNRRRFLALLAGYWVLFSFALLCLVGWGTAENGLILYSLYFMWAYAVLYYLLLVNLGDLIHFTPTALLLSLAVSGVLLSYNIPAIIRIIQFASTQYPLS